MNFIKNIYFNRILGIIFSLIFLIPTALLIGETSVTSDQILKVFSTFLIAFLIIYGIPINIIVKKQKRNLRKNLGIRLVKEVNKINNGDYKSFNKKNGEYLRLVKDYVVRELTDIHKNSIDEINDIDKKIEELRNTIKEEKSTTSALIEKHPFIKTLQDLQNRAN